MTSTLRLHSAGCALTALLLASGWAQAASAEGGVPGYGRVPARYSSPAGAAVLHPAASGSDVVQVPVSEDEAVVSGPYANQSFSDHGYWAPLMWIGVGSPVTTWMLWSADCACKPIVSCAHTRTK